MKTGLTGMLALAFAITGCATIHGGPGDLPVGLTSGVHSFKFVYKAPFLLDRNYLDVSTTYTGQWSGNRPKGRGEAVGSYGLRCAGEFGIEPANPLSLNMHFTRSGEREYFVWASGEVYANNTLIFRGIFRNNFYLGEGCLPAGDGVWFAQGSQITGKFETDIVSRAQSGRVFVNHYLTTGPCKILRKDGSSYTGDCRAPATHRAQAGSIHLNVLDLSDPFVLAAPWGKFSGADGQK